jgi:hypothetical protein
VVLLIGLAQPIDMRGCSVRWSYGFNLSTGVATSPFAVTYGTAVAEGFV